MTLAAVKKALRLVARKEKAAVYQGFFKTAPGEYGAGDVFLGVTVPEQRTIAREHADLTLAELKELLYSPVHEERMTALIILTLQYKKAKSVGERKKLFDFYVKHLRRVNNWDLVDVTCPHIIGAYLLERKDRSLLYRLARSKNLWERRVAMVSTHAFIRKNDLDDAFKIATLLLDDNHDLLHKAVGWMLRECGKRDEGRLELFLKKHVRSLSRTTLRYAIERFPEAKRLRYLRL